MSRPARIWSRKRDLFATLKLFANDFVADDLLSLAAALSFYTTLALSPLLLLALTFAGSLYAPAQERLIAEFSNIVGPQVEPMLRQLIDSSADHPDLRNVAGWWSLLILIVGASGVLAQLQASLNRVWSCENAALSGIRGFLRRRVLSAGVLLALLFVTIVSMGVQVLMSALPSSTEGALLVVSWLIGISVYTLLFASMYRWLPDCRIPWLTALRGGLITAVLFMVGRTLIGLYLANTNSAGAFGPAAGVVLWLIWAYYSSLVFLIAAELLYALARVRGWQWAPNLEAAAITAAPELPAGPGSVDEIAAEPRPLTSQLGARSQPQLTTWVLAALAGFVGWRIGRKPRNALALTPAAMREH